MILPFTISPVTFWIALGFFLLALDVLAFGLGSGFVMFGSIGALATGLLIWVGAVPPGWIVSIASFTLISAASAALLWKPMKALQARGQRMGEDASSDLIGDRFVLDAPLERGQPGKRRWSGVDWKVELAAGLTETRLEAGTEVEVARVQPGIFFVRRATDTT